jgi:putative inorganic carbon (hco3(-)) transporter
MKNRSLLINWNLYLKNILVFLVFYVVFFLYNSLSRYDNTAILLFSNFLFLFVFLATIINVKWGLYIFIFFVPLLNTLTTILSVNPIDFPMIIFFAFFLGFICNYLQSIYYEKLLFLKIRNGFDRDVLVVIVVFSIICFSSALISIFRYANFYPFITNNYYNLKAAREQFDSTGAILWTNKFFFNYISGFLAAFAVFNICKKLKDIINCIIAFVVSTFLSSLMLFFQYSINPYVGSFRYWVETGRLNATFTDPNSLGAYTFLMFPIFICMIIYFKKWYLKLVFGIASVVLLVMIILSGSRSSLLGIFITIIFFLIFGISTGLKKLRFFNARKKLVVILSIILIIILLLSSLLFIFLSDNPVKNKLLTTGLMQRATETVITFFSYLKTAGFTEALKSISNYRYIFGKMAILMFKDYPLTGVGPGAYLIELPDYYYNYERGFSIFDFSGNYYLQILSEMGAAGLILILFIFFLIIKKVSLFLTRNKNAARPWVLWGLFISIICMLVIQFFGPHTNFSEIQFVFWIIIGAMLAYLKINEFQNNNINSQDNNYDRAIEKKPFRPVISISRNLGFGIVQKILLSIFLIIFIGIFFKASITTLSISAKQDKNDWKNEYGFYNYENFQSTKARWISIDASTVLEKEGSILSLYLQDGNPVKYSRPNNIKVYIDNYFAGSIKLKDDSWYNLDLKIPAFTGKRITVTIVSGRSWVPKEVGLNNDSRELAIRLGEFKFK